MLHSARIGQEVDWGRDICSRCHLVITMPADGGCSTHVCVHDPVPWESIANSGVRAAALRSIGMYALRLGFIYATRERPEVYPELGSLLNSPLREGPFEPASPPPPVLMGDLLLWTEQDLLALPDVGPQTLRAIRSWLAEQGYTLARRDVPAAIEHLHARIAARTTENRPPGLSRLEDLAFYLVDLERPTPPPPVRVEVYANELFAIDALPRQRVIVELAAAFDMRVVGLRVNPLVSHSFAVNSIVVNGAEQIVSSEAVPAELFSDPDPFDNFPLNLPMLRDGRSLVVEFENVTDQDVQLRAMIQVTPARQPAPPPHAFGPITPQIVDVSTLSSLVPTPPILR